MSLQNQSTTWSDGGQDCFEIVSNGHKQTASVMSMQHLWLPVQDENKIKPVITLVWRRVRLKSPTPAVELLMVESCRGRKVSLLSGLCCL